MKKADNQFSVTKHQTPKGVRVYTVKDFFGEVLCVTKSQYRDYVALMINWYIDQKDGSKKWNVAYRFGRMDLVGKGDSRHTVGNSNFILVKVGE